ncbi:MAG: type II toxin-antitoxin system prevent-host-death family antitoxin [Candidatus Dormibacteraeota bacterium]|nr:type II toxin-antitoxin system prevent-host-death family antitoxin [Candidatus Dormibacteraeota bacterium]
MATRITVRALRINPSEIMRRVRSGESFEVTVRGEKVATIQPYSARTPYQQLEEEGAIIHGRHDIDWASWEPLPPDHSRPTLSDRLERLRADER